MGSLTRRTIAFALGAGLASAPTAAQSLPKWSAVPDLILDGRALILSPISQVRVDRLGQIYVAQPSDYNIRVFSPSGAAIRTIGRKGGGRDEFGYVGSIGILADTLWVYDPNRRRLSFFSIDGKYRRSTEVKLPRIPQRKAPVEPLVGSLRADGSYVGEAGLWVLRPAPESWAIIHATIDGRIIGVMATQHVSEGKIRGSAYDRDGNWRYEGAANPRTIASSLDGQRTAVVEAHLSGPDAGRATIAMLRGYGDTAYVARIPIAMEPLPRAVHDSAAEAYEGGFRRRGATPPPRKERLLFYPPFHGLRVASNGSVILFARPTGSVRDYLFLDPQGNAVASLTLPKSFEPSQYEGDLIWGRVRDSDDVESVVRYRIIR